MGSCGSHLVELQQAGPNSGRQPAIGMPPAFSNDLGSGAHIAWSDTNTCGDEGNNNRFTICYSHVLTGQVGVEFDETFYHVIEPGQQTIYNMTMNTHARSRTSWLTPTASTSPVCQ